MKKHENKSEAAALRQKAEEMLKSIISEHDSRPEEAENLKLIHELQVHQIELELQNEELRRAREIAEAANDRYVSLYDFAPTGYFTLSPSGEIIELNLAGANLLGKNRSALKGSRFVPYVSTDTANTFTRFLEQAFRSHVKETCEVKLKTSGSLQVYVRLYGIVTENGKHCMITAVNISESKQAEDKLKESEVQYRNLANSGSALIWTSGNDQGFNFFNEPWLNFTGRTLEQEIGKGWTEGVHPDDIDSCIETIQAAFAKHEPFEMEYRLRHASGNYRWIVDFGTPNFTGAGEFLGYIGHCFDISERKKTEFALYESEEKYRSDLIFLQSVLESPISVVIFSIDKNYCYTKFSLTHKETMKKIWGVDIRIGMNMVDLIPDPQDREKAKSNFDRAFKGDHFIVAEEYGDKKLSRNYYDNYYSPLKDPEGNIVGVTVFILDVSQRRKAELKITELNANLEQTINNRTDQFKEALSRLEKIADRVPGVVYQYRLNPDGSSCFPYASEGIREIYRVSPEEVAHDASAVFARIHPDDIDNVAASIQDSAQTLSLWQHDYRVKLNDGAIRWLAGNAMPQQEADGSVLWHGFISDITERRQAEEDLDESREKYRGLSEASFEAIFFSEKGLCIEQNMAAELMFGYTSQEAQGRYGTDWIVPEDREKVAHNILSGFGDPYEATALRKDGTTFPCMLRGRMMNYKGRNVRVTSLTDITGQKMAQDALRLKDILHSTMISNISDVIGIMGVDGVMKYKSPNIEKHFGWKPQDLIGTDGWLTIFPDDLDRIQKEFFELLAKEKSVKTVKYRYKCKNGSYKPIELTATNLVHDPVIQGVLLNYHDITEREEAENSLRRSEAALKMQSAAFESFALTVIITDIAGRIQWVNSAFTKLTGYTIDEAIGKRPGELIKSGKQDTAFYKKFWDTILSKKVWSGEIVNRRKDGSLYYEEETITPVLDDEGNIYSFIAIKIDITERKKLFQDLATEKRRLADIIKGTNAGTWEWNIQTGETTFNERWAEILGYTLDEIAPVSIRTWMKYAHADDLMLSDELLKKHFKGELPYYSFESRMKHKNGEWIWVLDRGKVHEWDKEGKPLLMSGTHLDITEQKRIEDALTEAKNEAEKANQAKSEFLSRMSHELRTPMNSILGFAQLLQMGDLKAPQKRGVKHIMNSGKHLLNLINEVLDISGIEAGRVSLSLIPVSAGSFIGEAMDTVRPMTSLKHVNIELINAGTDRLFVKADPHRLRQVLLNLISNAVKYNRDGGSVIVRTELQEAKAMAMPFVRISVSDTGPGIHPELIDKLFAPFERIGAEKTGIEGTGLGLMVVKKLVDAMGGHVGVESVPGEGSTFWIELPHIAGQEAAAELSEHRIFPRAIIKEKAGTILYIEDNTINTELVEQILLDHRSFIHFISSTKGAQAVPMAIEFAPDLILLDLDLPDMQGFDVITHLQMEQKTRAIPVVVVSADAMASQMEKLTKAGCKDYLTKPLDIRAFLEVVDEWVGNVK